MVNKIIGLKLLVTSKYQFYDIKAGMRMSIWKNSNPNYTMPCEVLKVKKEGGFHLCLISILDKDDYVNLNNNLVLFSIGYPYNVLATGGMRGYSEQLHSEHSAIKPSQH